MTKTLNQTIDNVIEREGPYVNHPADRGGPTRFGITQAKAREDGYAGDMREFPRDRAFSIYWRQFVTAQGIDLLAKRSPELAAEALDTGVNMGAPWGVMFLQRVLNACNEGGKLWPDLAKIDGNYGGKSDAALAAYLAHPRRGRIDVLLAGLNALQGERYIGIAERNASQEAFLYGWLLNRVALAA
ncbi:glycoside hydrolase family 108 protein [Sphingobium sp.]|uniref:glycoside hydrolase family 108 protein n=1 Tax=Sphingobium sp. TaxID=1912891 RepID=UPI0028BD977E|nr:glycosyl hydrolase 108 family protein [Sphingobium sp.]